LEIDASFYADSLILVVWIECIFDLPSERVLRPSLEHDYAVLAKCHLEWTRFDVQTVRGSMSTPANPGTTAPLRAARKERSLSVGGNLR